MNDEELREFAVKRLKKQAAFRNYLWTWLGVSLLCSGIWFFTSPTTYFWPVWVIFGMGVGALFSGIDAYRTTNPNAISDDAIDREVNRLKGTPKS
ncbi:MAG: 2TM domain-containing protein [Microbacteriaceae bacterium]|jgi:FtsH-binding integral membrane protein